jgi:hypothetical protein
MAAGRASHPGRPRLIIPNMKMPPSVITAAIDRSTMPKVSSRVVAAVRISGSASPPRMLEMLSQVRKIAGASTLTITTVTARATAAPDHGGIRARRCRTRSPRAGPGPRSAAAGGEPRPTDVPAAPSRVVSLMTRSPSGRADRS